ncbi:MAG: GMC family oxidoreductase N-terminal domain-containing protein [Rhizobiales bacterium]|nr:GMC family oxidoreductase N-terminal domain-containing protein [Hyphomicrobiales bacterium]
MLGGSSAINARVYNHGPSQNYDDWYTKLSNAGWSYNGLLLHFKVMKIMKN